MFGKPDRKPAIRIGGAQDPALGVKDLRTGELAAPLVADSPGDHAERVLAVKGGSHRTRERPTSRFAGADKNVVAGPGLRLLVLTWTITNNLQTFEIPTNGESVSLNPYLDTGRRFMPKST